MMNIFIMVLVAVFMVGYYIINSPSQRITEQETEYAITRSDLRSIAECAKAAHNAKIKGLELSDICMEQSGIKTETICLNANLQKTSCEVVRNKKPEYSYIVTTSTNLSPDYYNSMIEILEEYYSDAGAFGIFLNGKILSGDANTKNVPDAIISALELQDGQLVYMTQYEIPDESLVYTSPITQDVICPVGTVKTYRFGRWQCLGYNPKIDCGGDMIWDSEVLECVPDESKKPLCAGQQTAVIVDDVWECINPFPDKVCPDNMVAKLNYNTLEWECVTDPNLDNTVKKCETVSQEVVFGAIGTTLRVTNTSCTDCEIMVTDTDTCVSYCIPDPNKLKDSKCYPGNIDACSGKSKGIYFGFPNYSYASRITSLQNVEIPFDKQHSQNRKFNCLDCGTGEIDTEKSVPPYVSVCK